MNKIYVSILLYSGLILLILSIANGFMFNIDVYVHHFLKQYLSNDSIAQTLNVIAHIFSPFNCLLFVLIILAFRFFINKKQFMLYGFWSFSVFFIVTKLNYKVGR